MHIILASQSPRRRELLERAGYKFDIEPSDEEEIVKSSIPSEVVMELSRQKANYVFDKHMKNADPEKDLLVIGADTVVSIDKEILGKPKDEEDAFNMIKRLQAKSHKVYTGVSLVYNVDGEKKCHTFYEETEVIFYPMTDDEIRSYIKTKEPMDKAGAYGIQGLCGIYIEKINGDYNNVVGLPIARVYQEIKKLKLDI